MGYTISTGPDGKRWWAPGATIPADLRGAAQLMGIRVDRMATRAFALAADGAVLTRGPQRLWCTCTTCQAFHP